MKSPLTIIVICNCDTADSDVYVSALRNILVSSAPGGTFSGEQPELVHPVDFRVFYRKGKGEPDPETYVRPGKSISDLAMQAERVLIIILLASSAAEATSDFRAEWVQWLVEHKQAAGIFVALTQTKTILAAVEGTEFWWQIVSLGLDDLDERDLRPDLLCLHGLNIALHLLHSSEPHTASLFFSHAKRDGVPLAKSLVFWVENRLEFFYDTKHLDLTGDLNRQLGKAVASSIIVVLRTEAFDQRYWCQKEIMWSEEHAVPVITVDARWNLQHRPSVMGYDSSPSVRIPDGSLVRILLAAMIEGLRVALLRARVRLAATQSRAKPGCADPEVVPRHPGMLALHFAGARAAQSGASCVVYPNPALPEPLRSAACACLTAAAPDVSLLSLDEYRIVCLAPKP